MNCGQYCNPIAKRNYYAMEIKDVRRKYYETTLILAVSVELQGK